MKRRLLLSAVLSCEDGMKLCWSVQMIVSCNAPAFTQKLVAAVSKLKMGSGLNEGTTQGPLVSQSAVNKVKEHIQYGLKKGGKILIGGEQPDRAGFFCEPAVLSGASPEMQVAQDETFGPLAALFEFGPEEEGIKLANSTQFGLAGYLFSSSASQCALDMRGSREDCKSAWLVLTLARLVLPKLLSVASRKADMDGKAACTGWRSTRLSKASITTGALNV